MAADIKLRIEADVSQALTALKQLNTALGNIEQTTKQASSSLSNLSSTANMAKNAFTAMLATLAGQGLFNFVDSLQNMENKLRIATKSTEEFNQANAYVKAIADKTGQSLTAVGDLYAAVARNAGKLGYDTQQVATVTNAMATALKASGASAEGARSTLYQFSQILAKGKVNGDEFTTIMENLGGPVMDLVAKNMGLTTAELVKLKEKGLIGAKDFTDALIRSMAELDQMGGKALPTLGQNLQRIQNAFADMVLKFDAATGASAKIADAMGWLAKNIDVVIVAGATMLAVFAIGRIVAIATAIRALAVEMGVLQAILTTISRSPILLVLSGVVAAFSYFAGKKLLGDAPEQTADLADAAKNAAASLGDTKGQLTGIQDKFKDIVKDLTYQSKISADTKEQFDLQNQILNYNKQLEYMMTAEQKAQLSTLLLTIEANKQIVAAKDQIRKLTSDTTVLGIADAGQRQVAAQLEQFRLSVNEKVYNQMKGQMETAIQSNLQAKARRDIEDDIAKITAEAARLNISDLNVREQQAAVDDARLKYGTLLTAEMEKQIRASIAQKQAIQETLAVEQARRALSGTMTNAETIGRSVGVVQRLDPSASAAVQFKQDQQALDAARAQGLINQQQYNEMTIKLEQEKAARMLEINQSLAEQQMRQNGVTNQAIIDMTKQQMANVQMIQKGGIAGFQGMLGAASSVFQQLGTTNKKAFDTYKALATAQAIISTYQAAAMAIAMPPGPPLSFIYVAGAIAAGMAQVAAIRSQQYSGRSLGGPVMSGSSYIVGENGPELFTPQTTGSITRNSDLQSMGSGSTNVIFNITANDTAGFDDLLVKRRGLITQIIRDAQLERGQRLGA